MKNNPLALKPNKKVAVFIDGANLYAATRTIGWEVDFKRLRKYLGESCDLFRVYYYTAINENDDGSATVMPLIDWLDYNGYTVRWKPSKEFTDDEGRKKTKGNTNVEMTVDMMRVSSMVDQIVIFSGDGDLLSVVQFCKENGNGVTVVSTKKTKPAFVADELRREADLYVDLADEAVIATLEREDGDNPRGSRQTQDRPAAQDRPVPQDRPASPERREVHRTGAQQGHTGSRSYQSEGVDRTLRMQRQ